MCVVGISLRLHSLTVCPVGSFTAAPIWTLLATCNFFTPPHSQRLLCHRIVFLGSRERSDQDRLSSYGKHALCNWMDLWLITNRKPQVWFQFASHPLAPKDFGNGSARKTSVSSLWRYPSQRPILTFPTTRSAVHKVCAGWKQAYCDVIKGTATSLLRRSISLNRKIKLECSLVAVVQVIKDYCTPDLWLIICLHKINHKSD